jgi:hypothetical protein
MQVELDSLEGRYLGTAAELQQLRSAQSSKEQRLRSRLAQVRGQQGWRGSTQHAACVCCKLMCFAPAGRRGDVVCTDV